MHSFDSDTTEGKKSNCMQHFVITMWLLDKGYLKKTDAVVIFVLTL